MARRIDDTGFGGFKIVQNPEAFCYGVDAVLLSGFTEQFLKNRKCPDSLVDLGAGNGIVPLILSHKTEIPNIIGVEVQEENVKLAEETIQLNGLQKRMKMHCVDIADVLSAKDAPGVSDVRKLLGSVDIVTSNPPYFKSRSGAESMGTAKALARQESTATLSDFFNLASRLLKPKGDLFMIHRPSRLVDLLAEGRAKGLEAKDMLLVSGHKDEIANLVLLHFVKGGGQELHVLPSMAVREADGSYTAEMRSMYELKF